MAAENKHTDELLNLYLDRELTHEEEQQLYARLAEDAQLRARLKHMQTLRSETRNYLSGLTPSAAVTGSIFAGLGFSSSMAHAAAHAARETATTAGASSASAGAGASSTAMGTASTTAAGTLATSAGLLPTLQTLWIPISAAILSATLTTIVVLSVVDSDMPEQQIQPPMEQSAALQGTIAGESKSDASGEIQAKTGISLPNARSERSETDPSVSEPVNHGSETRLQTQRHTGSKPAPPVSTPVPAATGHKAHDRTSQAGDATMTELSPAQNQLADVPAIAPQTSLASPDRIPMILTSGDAREVELDGPALLVLERPHKKGFSVKLRGYAAQSYPGIAVGTRPKYDLERMFENASLGIYYRLSSNELLGVEVGQDAFAQQYNGFIRGKDREVRQNLLAPWATVNYRYNFDGLFGQVLFQPYLGGGAGFTQQAWPLALTSAGLMLSPNSTLEMMFGLEGMLMTFPFDGQWFSSKKLGFSYAIVVNF